MSAVHNRASAFGDYTDFGEAAEDVMAMLDAQHGLDAWFITRVRLDEWIVTHLRGRAPFERGQALTFAGDRWPEGAFVAAPLVIGDELFGMLCGLDTSRRLPPEQRDSPHIMTASRILSTILRGELEYEELQRRVERAEAEALVDELTGLFNRRGWERLTEREETRSARYGHGATVFVMDVDGLKRMNDEHGHPAGDELLRRVGAAIRRVVREHDVAARFGGDEFAVLAVETDEDQSRVLRLRLEEAFAEAGVAISIGAAHRTFEGGIADAVRRADRAMYACKAARDPASKSLA